MQPWTATIITGLQRFFLATNSLERQLYPALHRPVHFRPYESKDYAACCGIYAKNADGRLPPTDRLQFEEYLRKVGKTYLVAECESKVVGAGGVISTGPNTAVLCYGMVDPEYQRQRIGAMLTLLRISRLNPRVGRYYVFIYAVDASLPIYQKFGFIPWGHWRAGDGKDYPSAVLPVSRSTINTIQSTLQRRGVRTEGDLPLDEKSEMKFEVRTAQNRTISLHVLSKTGGPAEIQTGEPPDKIGS